MSGTRLTRQAWTEAALEAMSIQGTAGINVEQLARNLGTTKGSFYHHFEDRRALLKAALLRWEDLILEDLVTARLCATPHQRLEAGAVAGVGLPITGFVDLALASSLDDPDIREALQQVNEARHAFLTDQLRQLGQPSAVAARRATIGLGSYLGLFQLQRITGETFDSDHLRRLIVEIVETISRP
jgi:AcrR family transcriptional regulator